MKRINLIAVFNVNSFCKIISQYLDRLWRKYYKPMWDILAQGNNLFLFIIIVKSHIRQFYSRQIRHYLNTDYQSSLYNYFYNSRILHSHETTYSR